jgi:hypothetical protein
MNTAIEGGKTESGIQWETHVDYDYDTTDIRSDFYIIGTLGTGRHIKVDEYCDNMDEFDAALKAEDILYYQPLFMLAHSGVSVSLGGYNDPWDSGQCGFACITRDDATEWNILPHEYEEFLSNQVRNFDAALRGEVYRFDIYLENKCKECGCTSTETLDGVGGYVYPGGYAKFFEEVVEPAIAECERKLAEAEHQAEKGVKSDD